MTNPVFPTLSTGQDSKYFSVEIEDVALKSSVEAGYVVSRPKTTRKARRNFTSGFTEIIDADKVILETFYDLVKGGSVIFDWTDPSSGMNGQTPVVYSVRFDGGLKFTYKGIGKTKLWDVTFAVKQA